MAGPAFAVSGRGQQAVHHFFISVGRLIRQARRHFLWRGRQPGKIVREPPQQSPFFGGRREREARGFEARQQESVHGRTSPVPMMNERGERALHRLESPELSFFLSDEKLRELGRLGSKGARAALDPAL